MDIQTSLSRYEVYEKLGKGTYGTVYRSKDLLSNSLVALKEIQFKDSKDGLSPSILREVSILKQMSHPNIVSVKDFFIEDDAYYLTFEYLNQDLHTFLEGLNQPLSEAVIKYYMHQLLLGLTYCHSNCIIHRDLKSHNLLMSNDRLKIADFGLSKFIGYPDSPVTPTVQTLWYRAPELLVGGRYNDKIDVWSVGCIFGELINGLPIFQGANQIDQLWKIFRVLGTPTQQTWPGIGTLKGYSSAPIWQAVIFKELFPILSEDGIDFIRKVLVLDPAKRLNSYQALHHEYFREYNYVQKNFLN